MHADFEKRGVFLFELSQLWAAKRLQSRIGNTEHDWRA